MPSPVKVMFVRFPYGNQENPDVADWLVPTVIKAKDDPRISEILNIRIADTPITMTRNHAVEIAKKQKADFLVMIDSDMKPDAYLASNNYRLGTDKGAKPFFPEAFDFAYKHREANGPCAIGAPYCGPPPHENIYVFHWATKESEHANPDMSLEQFGREHAAFLSGIQRVAALPTGLILFDMECFDKIDPPYFSYEWTDEFEQAKASTEDVVLTRDLALAGVPQFCAWSSWAGHWKWKCVGRPIVLTDKAVSEKFRKAAQTPSVPEPADEIHLIRPGKTLAEKPPAEEPRPTSPRIGIVRSNT